MLQPCRRRERSTDLQTALLLQLDYCVDLFKLDAMTIADQSGTVVASTHTHGEPVAEVLAAYAPLLSRNRFRDNRGQLMAQLQRQIGPHASSVAVRRFHFAGDEFYVCSLGGLGARSELALHRAVNGVRRIMNSLR